MFIWQAHEGAVTSLAFGLGGRLLVSAGSDERVKAWDPSTGTEVFAISLRPVEELMEDGPFSFIDRTRSCLAISGDGTRAVIAQRNRGLVFLDFICKEEAFTHPFDDVFAVKPAPDGESVFALTSGPLFQYR